MWHLDMELLEERRRRKSGGQAIDKELEEQIEQEVEDQWSVPRLPCPQTELEKCAEEILAGVKRPTAVEAHHILLPSCSASCYCADSYFSCCSCCFYSSILQEEQEVWRNT